MDLLQRRGVRFGALVVLNRFNIGNPRGLVEFLVENGVTGYKLNPIAYLGAARDTWQDSGVRQEEVVDFVREVTEMVAYEGYPLVESNVRTMCEFLVSKRRATRCMRGHCGAGDSFQAVAAAGDIYPCGRSTQSPELKLGNVRDDIRSLDEPGRHNLHIVEIRNRRSDHLEGCQTCEYRQLCQAGCSAEAFERYGTVRHRTPQCHFFKTSYPWLMRWLSFDAIALARLAHYEYFGDSQVRLVDRSYVDDASPTLVGVP
jgi:radical SAM protein with 4Fe4S-binding SPASM domain